jgi:hypothetical protein
MLSLVYAMKDIVFDYLRLPQTTDSMLLLDSHGVHTHSW